MAEVSVPALEISHEHWQEMRAHILKNLPEEACGLVPGLPLQDRPGWRSAAILPITNVLHSSVRYQLEPHEHLAAFELIDSRGWELAAIFHSHPAGPKHPSAADIAESYYPDSIYLIWSPNGANWDCRAFIIREKAFQPADLRIV